MEDEEELQSVLLQKDPVTQQTLIQWATLHRHFMLVEYIVKRLQRSAFSFDPETMEVAIYNRWEEMRPELPTAAQVAERQQQREQERAKRLAERADDEEEEEEEEENEPTPEDLVFEALEEYHDQLGEGGVGAVKRIGELGVYLGTRQRDGTKDGLGQSLYPNGDCYAGEYKNNQRNGQGVYMWASHVGMLYVGSWLRNKRDGYGRMVYPDGSRYLGSWSSDVKSGRGRYTYADGSAYDGEWVAGQKHGHGVHQFTDGSSYVGTFVDNEFVCGEWHLAGGSVRYMGNFVNGQPTGSGVFVHRCGHKEGSYLEEGVYVNGKWSPSGLKGTTKFVPRLEVLAPHLKTSRVPIFFSQSCNGHTTADLVRAANFPPLQRWVAALPSALTDQAGVDLTAIEVYAIGYSAERTNHIIDLLIRPTIVDAAGKKIRTPSEEVLLKEPTTRLFTLLEKASGEEPLVVLEHSLQFSSPDPDHRQYRLPTVEVTTNGAIGGEFALTVGSALALRLVHADHTTNLVSPLLSNPFYTNASERVLLYRQQLHADAFANMNEKLQHAARRPGVTSYLAVPS
ncbi:hypothetical protein AGDE_10647 [Angomonas deanei]|nr:hypothetical protein AGDE_10647 [Angomonas deanei]|eukprot:EPY27676.1 hypothetical protein AGDE_10647 [Angomonas deanei]